MGWIYEIRNTRNGHRYIGQTTQRDPKQRLREHRSKLRRGKHRNTYLQRAFSLYGEMAFRFRLLNRPIPESLLSTVETRLIEKWGTYNINAGGDRGWRHSPETRRKISEGVKKSRAEKPLTHTDATKERIRERMKCRIFSDEHRERIAEAQRRRWAAIKAA